MTEHAMTVDDAQAPEHRDSDHQDLDHQDLDHQDLDHQDLDPQDLGDLEHLGKASNQPVDKVDLIPWTGSAIRVCLDCTEFTSLCPVTGQPDFATLAIEYVPDRHLVETKSLKLYLWRYRDRPAFNETLIDEITGDLFRQLSPKGLRVTGCFHPRGGIGVTVSAERGDAEVQSSTP